MFDFVRKHTRLFQGILLLLILPSFALVGMQGYTSFMQGSQQRDQMGFHGSVGDQ